MAAISFDMGYENKQASKVICMFCLCFNSKFFMMVPVASTIKKLKLSGMVLLNCIMSTSILDLATGLSKFGPH